MQFEELKERTYKEWERWHRYQKAVLQPEKFEAEIASFGDPASEETWIKFLSRFYAMNVWECCLDAYKLITLHFNFKETDWQYEFRHQIFSEFLILPDAVEGLLTGFRQLFGSEIDFTSEERNATNGILELVSGARGRGESEAIFLPEEWQRFQLQLAAS